MNQIIIATHSKLAYGLYEAVKFFNNEVSNVEYINCYDESNDCENDLRKAIKKHLGENIIVCTDIVGGSVNQFAAKLTREYKFHLISGTNLALLLELVFAVDDLSNEDIRNILEKSKQQLVYFEDLITNYDCQGNQLEDDEL